MVRRRTSRPIRRPRQRLWRVHIVLRLSGYAFQGAGRCSWRSPLAPCVSRIYPDICRLSTRQARVGEAVSVAHLGWLAASATASRRRPWLALLEVALNPPLKLLTFPRRRAEAPKMSPLSSCGASPTDELSCMNFAADLQGAYPHGLSWLLRRRSIASATLAVV